MSFLNVECRSCYDDEAMNAGAHSIPTSRILLFFFVIAEYVDASAVGVDVQYVLSLRVRQRKRFSSSVRMACAIL